MEYIILIIAGLIIHGVINSFKSKNKVSYTDSDGTKKTEQLHPRKPNNILAIEKPSDFELSEESLEILNLFENTAHNVFMTGKAGTGKSTLLRYFRATTKKNHAVVAPTGIAAINVQGQTIHSFFGFGIDITPSRVRYVSANKLRVIRNLQMLIIDEISMVRADLLDCVNASLQLNRRSNLPFGGVQIIAIGDPYQLPPVVKTSEKKYFDQVYGGAHFFHSKAFQAGEFQIRELTKVHRQKDEVFKQILNGIRNGSYTDDEITLLNTSVFGNEVSADTIKLVTTNDLARSINDEEMRKLVGKEQVYKAHVSGEFKEKDMPTETELLLKEGAMVLLLNNDKDRRWVNGTTAKIISVDAASIKVKFDENSFAVVEPHEWDNIQFVYNEEEKKIEPQIVGKFIQIPVKPAWAITIHKSQGQTYQTVHIDFGRGTFAPGQAYVALSRCTSLSGLSLEAPLVSSDIVVDEQVHIFMSGTDTGITQKRETTLSQVSRSSAKSDITKSDVNKLLSFINSPEKYTSGSEKAQEKVVNAKRIFEMMKSELDQSTVSKYEAAINQYNKLTRK